MRHEEASMPIIDIIIHRHTYVLMPSLRKREVNIDWGENKGKQTLYKEVPLGDESLEKRQYEVRVHRCRCWTGSV